MIRTLPIDDLRAHLEHAQKRLTLEKNNILKLHPLRSDFNREEYAFAYVRAERLGLRAINRRLAEIAWLPMQLDPRAEIMTDNRAPMKRWLTEVAARQPDSDAFGNDFMHALARGGLRFGWDHAEFLKLTARVADLFRDLSCLIGLIYYCTWLEENRIEGVGVSDPDDLNLTAEEITGLIQSPEMQRYLRSLAEKAALEWEEKRAAQRKLPPQESKKRPSFRVIDNSAAYDGLVPDPVGA